MSFINKAQKDKNETLSNTVSNLSGDVGSIFLITFVMRDPEAFKFVDRCEDCFH